MKPVIIWIMSGDGWVWDIRVKEMRKRMPEYQHIKVEAPRTQDELQEFRAIIREIDPEIIMALNQRGLKNIPGEYKKRTIVSLTSIRSFENWERWK